jgi:energy-coupling factor transport system substrate-specific component
MMTGRARRYLFSLRDLLTMAAFAALGGVSGSAVSWAGASLHAVVGLPGGFQFMAGIHILWLILAVGVVGKPGAATVTGLLKGAVEFLSGNPHGLIVVLLSGIAGIVVDLVWLPAGRRGGLLIYMLAGGLGAASNLLVFKLIVALPAYRSLNLALLAIAVIAFISGAILAGLLGWSLLQALRRAGVVGTVDQWSSRRPTASVWLGIGASGLLGVLIGTAVFFSLSGSAKSDGGESAALPEARPVP